MPFNEDFSGQLNELLAPYRRKAESMNSPYATMGQNSWLAQRHPKIAGYLDNAFLTAAMTPGPQGPEGVGGGISRMAQGLMGGQQFKRQRALESMMLPYQMLEPQLKVEGQLASIEASGATAKYHRSEAAWKDAQTKQLGMPQQAIDASEMIDDEGRPWKVVTTKRPDGAFEVHHVPILPQGQELPEGYQPSFEKSKNQKKFAGLSEAERYVSGASLDAVNQAREAQGLPKMELSDFQSSMMGFVKGRAGAGAAGAGGVNFPEQESQRFLTNEKANLFNYLPEVPKDFVEWSIQNPGRGTQEEFKKDQQDVRDQKAGLDRAFAKYQASGGHKRGIGFQEWVAQNPDAMNLDVETRRKSAVPSGTGSNWTPK